jgi:hypothetical protein
MIENVKWVASSFALPERMMWDRVSGLRRRGSEPANQWNESLPGVAIRCGCNDRDEYG